MTPTLETALLVPDRARLGLLHADLPHDLEPVGRLAFGVEFCEHLLPPADDAAFAAITARERGLAFTLITPYVTDRHLPSVEAAAMAALQAFGAEIEVVFADWGVLRRLRGRPGIHLTLGRTLNRAQRDPRVLDVGPEHLGGDHPPDSWSAGSHGSRAFDRFLRASGVGRLDADVPPTGLDAQGLQDGLPVALHLPFCMVASGRLCVVNALGKAPAVRFVPPPFCDAPCRTTTLHLRAPWQRRGSEGVGIGEALPLSALLARRRNQLPDERSDDSPRILQKGNSHFLRLDDDAIRSALAVASDARRVDRVVWSPVLPM